MFTRWTKIPVILLLVIACACKNKQYREDTSLFNEYLETYIHTSIPEDTVYWIVISEYGCEGCIGKTVTKMRSNDKAMFIVNENTYHRYIKPKKVAAGKYLIDSTGKIKRLQYHHHNVGIVQTANKEIYNIINIPYNDADSILAEIE